MADQNAASKFFQHQDFWANISAANQPALPDPLCEAPPLPPPEPVTLDSMAAALDSMTDTAPASTEPATDEAPIESNTEEDCSSSTITTTTMPEEEAELPSDEAAAQDAAEAVLEAATTTAEPSAEPVATAATEATTPTAAAFEHEYLRSEVISVSSSGDDHAPVQQQEQGEDDETPAQPSALDRAAEALGKHWAAAVGTAVAAFAAVAGIAVLITSRKPATEPAQGAQEEEAVHEAPLFPSTPAHAGILAVAAATPLPAAVDLAADLVAADHATPQLAFADQIAAAEGDDVVPDQITRTPVAANSPESLIASASKALASAAKTAVKSAMKSALKSAARTRGGCGLLVWGG